MEILLINSFGMRIFLRKYFSLKFQRKLKITNVQKMKGCLLTWNVKQYQTSILKQKSMNEMQHVKQLNQYGFSHRKKHIFFCQVFFDIERTQSVHIWQSEIAMSVCPPIRKYNLCGRTLNLERQVYSCLENLSIGGQPSLYPQAKGRQGSSRVFYGGSIRRVN